MEHLLVLTGGNFILQILRFLDNFEVFPMSRPKTLLYDEKRDDACFIFSPGMAIYLLMVTCDVMKVRGHGAGSRSDRGQESVGLLEQEEAETEAL